MTDENWLRFRPEIPPAPHGWCPPRQQWVSPGSAPNSLAALWGLGKTKIMELLLKKKTLITPLLIWIVAVFTTILIWII